MHTLPISTMFYIKNHLMILFIKNGKIKNWDAYANNAILLVETSKRCNTESNLNSLAWGFFENVKDRNHLEKALNWAEKSVKITDKFENNDTYACLLYVLGDTAKA